MPGWTRNAVTRGEVVLLGVFSGVVALAALILLTHPPAPLEGVAKSAKRQERMVESSERGAGQRKGLYDKSSSGVPVLCHHYLREKTTPIQFLKILGALFFNLPLLDDMDPWTQTATTFEAQMAYLKKAGYETVDLADVVAWQRGLRELPPKPVVITFDDGDRSVVDYAYPVLKKYGFKATLFVVTSTIGQKWDRVNCLGWEDLRRLRESGVFSIQSHSHDLHRKVRTSEGALPIFVAAKCGLYDFPGARSWEAGVYDDLRTSRSLIEQNVGGDVNSLAWPYGFGDAALDSVAASAGYTALCTLGEGTNRRFRRASWIETAGKSIEEQWGAVATVATPSYSDSTRATPKPLGQRVFWEQLEVRRYTITARMSLGTFEKLVAE